MSMQRLPTVEEMQELHRLVFETASDAIVWIANDGAVLHLNAAARAMLHDGLEQRVLEGWKRDPEVLAFRAELRARGRASLELRLTHETHETQQTRETRETRETHDTLHRRRRCIAIEGRTLWRDSVLTLRDVSRERNVEEELERLRRVAPLAEFAASIVHDLGNVLTPIGCLGEALERESSAGSQAQALASELSGASRHALELTRQLTAFVRRRESPRPQRVNVSEVLVAIRPLLARLVGASVEVDLELDDEAGAAMVDRTRLERVLLNLAANACDAMPSGGRLLLRTHAVILDEARAEALDCPRDGRYLVVTVTDRGAGMSAEVRASALDPFFTTKDAHGTGLGLSSAHGFATDYGGGLDVRSEVGDGTSIAIYLPHAGDLEPASEEPQPSSVDGEARGRIEVRCADAGM